MFLLQALKMLAVASSSESPTFIASRGPIQPLFDAQMTREIFASIDSATRPGSESLLLTIPAAVVLMLNTEGSGISLQSAHSLPRPRCPYSYPNSSAEAPVLHRNCPHIVILRLNVGRLH